MAEKYNIDKRERTGLSSLSLEERPYFYEGSVSSEDVDALIDKTLDFNTSGFEECIVYKAQKTKDRLQKDIKCSQLIAAPMASLYGDDRTSFYFISREDTNSFEERKNHPCCVDRGPLVMLVKKNLAKDKEEIPYVETFNTKGKDNTTRVIKQTK